MFVDSMSTAEWFFIALAAAAGFFGVRHLIESVQERAAGQPQAPLAPGATAPAWHQVLGVSEQASLEDIRLAYQRKISQYHPDKLAGLGPEFGVIAEARTKEINLAYQAALAARGSGG
jgi:DnaJ-domain-containing protein 1